MSFSLTLDETYNVLHLRSIHVACLMVERVPYGSTDVVRREGLPNHAPCAEEFRDVEKVLITRGAGDGNDSGIEEFLCQGERDFHSVPLRHQDVGDDEIRRGLSIERKTDFTIWGLLNLMTIFFKDVTQQDPNWGVILDKQNGSHSSPFLILQ